MTNRLFFPFTDIYKRRTMLQNKWIFQSFHKVLIGFFYLLISRIPTELMCEKFEELISCSCSPLLTLLYVLFLIIVLHAVMASWLSQGRQRYLLPQEFYMKEWNVFIGDIHYYESRNFVKVCNRRRMQLKLMVIKWN